MTHIEELARQAGMTGAGSSNYIADRSDLERFAALVRAECQAWVPVTERMPDKGVTVLACYTNRAGRVRRIRACWIAAKSEEADSECEFGEYDEAADCYWTPEGWYERIDNWDDYSSVAVCEGNVSHWMPLPPAPEGKT